EVKMSHCDCGHPEEVHLFGSSCRVPGCTCDRFSPIPEISAQTMVPADENSGDPARRGDGNHKRISVPGASTFSQQRPTSFDHYESAWQTSNTGSNPVGESNPCHEAYRSRPKLNEGRRERHSLGRGHGPGTCRTGTPSVS